MTSIDEHIKKSFAGLKETELSGTKKHILEQLIPELHQWLDFYSGKENYTGINCIKHREKRHHIEGIAEIRKILTEKYGEEFSDMIAGEARNHIIADMERLYSKSDYQSIGFWKRVRGF